MPIGVLDSGVGGFSILAQLESEFPDAQFVYLSDNKNFPYSEKSVARLQSIGEKNVQILQEYSCNPIVIACNTLTVSALAYFREIYPEITFIGTVPAVKPASELVAPQSTVVVLATKNTAESEYLQNLITPYKQTTHFELVGSTVLVEAIENWDETAIVEELKTILLPLIEKTKIAGLVLGCTHFAFIQDQIAEIVPNRILFFEPSWGIIKQVENHENLFTQDESYLTTEDATTPAENAKKITFLSTNPSESAQLAEKYEHLKTLLPE